MTKIFEQDGNNLYLPGGKLALGKSSASQLLDILENTGGTAAYINIDAASYDPLIIGVDGTGARLQSNSATAPLYFITNGSERLRIDSSGNVGVNLSTADVKLDVSLDGTDSFPSPGGSTVARFGNSGGSASIELASNNSNAGNVLFTDSDSVAIGQLTYAHSDNSLRIATNAAERVRITAAGELGIGTTTPNDIIHVDMTTGADAVVRLKMGSANGGANVAGTRYLNSNGTQIFSSLFDNSAGLFVVESDLTSDALVVGRTGGIGVATTPSSWGTFTSTIDFGTIGAIGASTTNLSLFANAYFDGTNYRYKTTSAAKRLGLDQTDGLTLFSASSGTAGNAISFNPLFTVSGATGNVEVKGNTNNLITTGTSDASDNKSLSLCGGGSNSSARGGYLQLFGNEHATNAGAATMVAGNIAGSELRLTALSSTSFVTAHTAGTERMRITETGDLLVGTTTVDGITTTGHQLSSSGYAAHARDSGVVFQLSRKTTDGAIIEFYKDTSLIGHIAAESSSLEIQSTNNIHLDTTYIGVNNTSPVADIDLKITGAAGTDGPIIRMGTSSSEGSMTGGVVFTEASSTNPNEVTMGMYYDGSTNRLHFTGFNNGANLTASLEAATKHLTIARDSGNVGINDSDPDDKLHIEGGGSNAYIRVANGSFYTRLGNDDIDVYNNDFKIRAGGAEIARFTTDGNWGVGVIPEAWKSDHTALQIGGTAAIFSESDTTLTMSENMYRDGVGRKYIEAGESSVIELSNGNIYFSYAASGTADAALTYTNAMRIDNSGNVGIGTTGTPTARLDVIESDQQFRFYSDSARPIIETNGTPASVVDGIEVAQVRFGGPNDASGTEAYGTIRVVATDVSNGSEDGRIDFLTQVNGTNTNTMSVTDGRVGIRTDSPNAELDVTGDVDVSGSSNFATNSAEGIRIAGSGGGFAGMFGTATNQNVSVAANGTGDLTFRTGGTPTSLATSTTRMTIDDSGNVGIGVTPTTKLHIQANTSGGPRADAFILRDSGFECVAMQSGQADGAIYVNAAGQRRMEITGQRVGTTSINSTTLILQAGGSDAVEISGTSGLVDVIGGVLSLGKTSNNGVINTQFSARLNIDSNNTSTGESFIIGHNQTAINQSNIIAKFQEDGKVAIGDQQTPDTLLHVWDGDAGGVSAPANTVVTVENSTDAYLQFLSPNTADQMIRFGDPQDTGVGSIRYSHSNDRMEFTASGGVRMYIQGNGYRLANGGWRRPDDAGDAIAVGNGTNSHYGSHQFNNASGSTLNVNFNAAGVCEFRQIGTTANAANAYIDNTASNSLLRSTSSIRYKQDIQTLTNDEIDLIYNLDPMTYRSKVEADDQEKRHFGFTAEHMHDEVSQSLVHYDDQGRPEGVQYDRVTVLLAAEAKRQKVRADEAEDKIASLENQLNNLEQLLKDKGLI